MININRINRPEEVCIKDLKSDAFELAGTICIRCDTSKRLPCEIQADIYKFFDIQRLMVREVYGNEKVIPFNLEINIEKVNS